jgi:ABC-2 type transport system ATP-binding protein
MINQPAQEPGTVPPAIEINHLTKVFKKLVAVNDISLSIPHGELFALLGPNGAGKTTLINMLCCLLRPTGGTAAVMGHDINRQPFQVKEIIGVSPQDTSISERLNVRENLDLIGRIHDIDAAELKKRSQELLKAMGLTERSKEQVRRFSGGMKRRLSIMMALIHNPDVIFLDEPTLGLDPQARRAIWDYIGRLKGIKTILLTTHYMDEADVLSDRIGIMDEGEIVALGSGRELKAGMAEKQTMVIYAWNLTQRVVEQVRGQYTDVKVADGTLQITDRELDFKKIVDLLQSAGAVVRSASIKEPTLEDVFLQLTGKELRE